MTFPPLGGWKIPCQPALLSFHVPTTGTGPLFDPLHSPRADAGDDATDDVVPEPGGGAGGLERVTIIAGRFASASAARTFSAHVAALPGVRLVEVRHFLEGYLSLVVEYEPGTALVDQLRQVGPWRCQVLVPGPGVIELRFVPPFPTDL